MLARVYRLLPKAIRDRARGLLHAVLTSDIATQAIRAQIDEPLIWGDPARVRVHETVNFKTVSINVVSGSVTIERDVLLSHHVILATGTHDVSKFGTERYRSIPADGRDIHIEEGVMIGSGAIITGPCRIGRHAVVYAGAVVTKDVAPYTHVAGVPAQPRRTVQESSRS